MNKYERIKLIILDVDGTLTDGRIIYDSVGNELKCFDVKDGLAIKVAIESGLCVAVLTGRESPIVARRVKELGIQHLRSGLQMKYPAMMALLRELKISVEQVCYIGDDLNDLQCMLCAGVKMCPHDAAEEIKNICDYVSVAGGGHGAVRECIQQLVPQRTWGEIGGKLYFSAGDGKSNE